MTTAKERDANSAVQIDQALGEIGRSAGAVAGVTSTRSDHDAVAQHKRFTGAVGAWSRVTDCARFVKLVKEQPLDRSQMNWQVGIQDVSLLVETGKLEKMVEELVTRRGASAKIDHRCRRRSSTSARRS